MQLRLFLTNCERYHWQIKHAIFYSTVSLTPVLSQLQPDDTERVIAYGNCSLNDREKNDCITRLDMLA